MNQWLVQKGMKRDFPHKCDWEQTAAASIGGDTHTVSTIPHLLPFSSEQGVSLRQTRADKPPL